MPVDDRIGVITPEAVEFSFDLSGLGSRVFALLIDLIIQSVLVMIVLVVLITIGMSFDTSEAFSPSMIILMVVILFFEWGYFIFFELMWDGRSPGKRMMGCRVIRDGGLPVDFTASLIRNLIRPIDYFLSALMIGFFIVFASPSYKRLGDMAAGTVVVTERRLSIVELLAERKVGAFRPTYPPLGLFTKAEVSKLSTSQIHTIRRFLDRRSDLPIEKRNGFASALYNKLVKILPTVGEQGINIERVLEEIIIATLDKDTLTNEYV